MNSFYSLRLRPVRRAGCGAVALLAACLVSMAQTLPDSAAPTPGAEDEPSPQPYRLPTIVVTGEPLPSTSPFSDASSVSFVSGAEVRERGVVSARDLSTITPNLLVLDANGDRVPRFSIRGLRDNNFSVGEPSVTLYIDDVPYNDLSSRGVPFHDVDQVDFLRGPQGTLFGVARPGGVINVVTRLPSNDCRGRADLTYGSYDTWTAEAGASGPLVKDRWYFDVSGLYDHRGGYLDNDFLGTHPDVRETYAGRAAMRFTPTERLDLTLAVTGERFNDGAVAIGPIGGGDPFKFNRDFDGSVDTWGLTESLRLAYTAPSFKLVSVTAHRDWQQDLLQDFDFSTNDVVRGFTNPDLRQWSEELRVQSPDDLERWRWVAGGFFASRELDADSGSRYAGLPLPVPPYFLPGPFVDRTTAAFDDRTYALFGQATWMGVEHLELTAGLRWDYDERSFVRDHLNEPAAQFGAPPVPRQDQENSFSALQPRGAVAYHVRTNVIVFGSVAMGYQSGGFHLSSDDPASAGYGDMTSVHYEVGTRTDWWEKRVGISVSLFRTDFSDYQVYRPVTATQFAVMNADRVSAMGADLEVGLRPVDALRIEGNVGYAHAEFDRFRDPLNGVNLEGRTVNFVPEFTWNLGARYQFPRGFYVRADGQGVGRFYFDEANTVAQKPYALLHARVGWESDRFGVAVFGRNLTDETYYANAINFRDPQFNADFFVGTPGNPRVFGVVAFARF